MKRVDPGHYDYGRVPDDDRKHGDYGIIRGDSLNENGHTEFKGFIGHMKSKWFVYRIYDNGGLSSVCVKTELLKYFDSKKEAKSYLDSRVGSRIE